MAKSNSIRTEKLYSDITLGDIRVGQFQKEHTKTAVLRQAVTTIDYVPKQKVENDLNDSLVSVKEFNLGEEKRERVEHRVAFVMVPDHYTRAQVEQAVTTANEKGGRLYRVMSYQPILSEDDRRFLSNCQTDGERQKFMEKRANRQALRYPSSHKLAGQLILDDMGRIRYRDVYFSMEGVEDVNACDPNNCWAPQSLLAEARQQLGNGGQAADDQTNDDPAPAVGVADDCHF